METRQDRLNFKRDRDIDLYFRSYRDAVACGSFGAHDEYKEICRRCYWWEVDHIGKGELA